MVSITDDADNNALISSAEAVADTDVSITLPADAVAGDQVRVTDGTTTNTITLAASDINTGNVSSSFTAPANGTGVSISATIIDAAGNISAGGSDHATYDLTAPSVPVITLTEDASDDGFISTSELSGDIDVTVSLPSDAVAGDTITVSDGNDTNTIVLTASDITAGWVTTAFSAGSDGSSLSITATLTDPAGNSSSPATVNAHYDFTAPSAPGIVITEDTNVDGWISIAELDGDINVEVSLPLDADAGDTLRVSDGVSAIILVLTPADRANGSVNATFASGSDTDLLSISASLTDAAGNTSGVVTDIAVYDLSAPFSPQVRIAEDTDNNGLISVAEQLGDLDVQIGISPDAVIGDTLTVTEGRAAITIFLSADDIAARLINTTFSTGADADIVSVAAVLTDASGNSSIAATDAVTFDLTPPGTPQIIVAEDVSDDGVITYPEFAGSVGIIVLLPANATTGDTVTITDNSIIKEIAVSTADIATGAVSVSFDAVNFNDSLTVATTLSDPAGNHSAAATASAIFELSSDADGDRIPDRLESTDDTDGDGLPDYLDTDSDGDGIDDVLENRSTPSLRNSDQDADGIDDALDINITGGIDADNNGIDDAFETTDTDRDGLPNTLDLDSDNDGIPDSVEGALDADADGIPDYIDLDTDGDGIDDTIEGAVDTDNDGVPNYLDNDSDGDGLSDADEGTHDLDADGIADYLAAPIDPGLLDHDNDGLSDAIEGAGNVDTDNDGIPDNQDSDSDNDGIDDAIEANFNGQTPADFDRDGVLDYIDLDADNDGIPDLVETAADTDGDGVADYRDLDVDNDGILDIIEAHPDIERVYMLDTDLDGEIDPVNHIYGGNGIADIVETAPDSGMINYELSNADTDTQADYKDLDSDNDGIFDTIESDHPDKNFDGVIDATVTGGSQPRSEIQTSLLSGVLLLSDINVDDSGLAALAGRVPPNQDGDGQADFRDVDSDNDGLTDLVETGSMDIDNDGSIDLFTDTNNNGVHDDAAAIDPVDSDHDGVTDFRDVDSDQDGVPDLIESGGEDIDGNGVVDHFIDANNDGLDDVLTTLSITMRDQDLDGLPDYLDLDSDNDGVFDIVASGYTDIDGDGTVDRFTDLDGDGFQSPDEAPAAESDTVLTGLNGSGCVIIDQHGWIDPLLPFLLILSLTGLYHNRQRGRFCR
ncbi:hypothetical protein AB833_01480 [Chromatiales bacterium (ex Bugula neritina AB1)]|nr:hypothetical protein AB833_01480 [Chromatiales bacterium (ex Bugula neritina AB1)]